MSDISFRRPTTEPSGCGTWRPDRRSRCSRVMSSSRVLPSCPRASLRCVTRWRDCTGSMSGGRQDDGYNSLRAARSQENLDRLFLGVAEELRQAAFLADAGVLVPAIG